MVQMHSEDIIKTLWKSQMITVNMIGCFHSDLAGLRVGAHHDYICPKIGFGPMKKVIHSHTHTQAFREKYWWCLEESLCFQIQQNVDLDKLL